MGIRLSDLLDDGNRSMRDQAALNHLPRDERFPYFEFTMRELITPQHQVDEVGLASSSETWQNWVGQHRTWENSDGDEERDRNELRPTNPKQLVAAVVEQAVGDSATQWSKVRAVGSGHSHSNAPAPGNTYIELDPGEPGESVSDGLNRVLGHEGWLKDDDELAAMDSDDDDDDGHHNPLTGSPLEPTLDREHLKRLEAGIVLRRLNRHILHPEGYALQNMGSFDGQTLAGAINTSTHGTGIGLPSISDAVKSVEIATVPSMRNGNPYVKLYRIEPSDGITDRDAFEADTGEHEMELIQDDDVFHSVVVGYGCMGVVYAYTLQVVDNYWLKEETDLLAWSTLKRELGRDRQSVTEFLTRDGTRHCQILLNTAAEQVPKDKIKDHSGHGQGQHEDRRDPLCLVTRHKVTSPPDNTHVRPNNTVSLPDDGWVNPSKDRRWPPERLTRPFRDFGKAFTNFGALGDYPGKAKQLHDKFFHPQYRKDPFVGGMHKTVWYVALRRIRDRGDLSTAEHFHPPPPQVPAITTEIGFPVGDVVEAVDEFRRKVRNVVLRGSDVEEGEVFFPVPMGIRFTAASDHYLSPEYGRETAMVELPIPLPTNGFIDIALEDILQPALTEVERHVRDELSHLDPRPHMGKHNTVTAEWLGASYEYFDADGTDREMGWHQAYRRFNAFETFDNKFTEQLYDPPLSFQSGELPETEQPTDPDETEQPTGTGGTDQPGEGDTGTERGAAPADDGATETSQPGLGFLTGLAGVGTGAWLLDRRADGDDADADAESGATEPSDARDSESGAAEPNDARDSENGAAETSDARESENGAAEPNGGGDSGTVDADERPDEPVDGADDGH